MRPTLQEIFDVTLDELNISKDSYKRAGKSREARMVRVRQIFSYIGRHFGYTTQTIADFIGMHHASICYHSECAKDACRYEKGYINKINNILSHFDNVQRVSVVSGWLARSEDGTLEFFKEEPNLFDGVWTTNQTSIYVEKEQFPQINLVDSPIPCEMTLRLK